MYHAGVLLISVALYFSQTQPPQPAWVAASNSYTNRLLAVEMKHHPETGSTEGLSELDNKASQPTRVDEDLERQGKNAVLSEFKSALAQEKQKKVAETALGTRFNQKKFHDFIVAQGVLPPDLLRQAVIEDFVPAQQPSG